MENKPKTTVRSVMRALHRDLGFLVIAMLVVHAVSGIDLVYRDRDLSFLRKDKPQEMKLPPDIRPEDLKDQFIFKRMRNFRITGVENNIVSFTGGSYNSTTGDTRYTRKESVFPFNKFIKIHKAMSRQATHVINVLFGIAMLFLAVSSFWMFRPGHKCFTRGIWFTLAGTVITVILIFI
jgi:hypothetical protein